MIKKVLLPVICLCVSFNLTSIAYGDTLVVYDIPESAKQETIDRNEVNLPVSKQIDKEEQKIELKK